MEKPLLIFDGDCGFCRVWVRRWRHVTAEEVEYLPYQEASGRAPQIPMEKFKESVALVEPDGTVSYAAHAVFRALSHAPGHGFWLKLYQRFPSWAKFSEALYRVVARNRVFFSKLSRFLWGDASIHSTYEMSRWIFLRFLGLIYLSAFISLWLQADGLYGPNGISPVNSYLEMIRGHLPGAARFWAVPSLLWFNEVTMDFLLFGGIFLSLVLIAGILEAPVLLVLWAFYLSLCAAGQEFMSFQWDILLLETGFLAVFLASWRSLPAFPWSKRALAPASAIALFLLKFLLFKLMFSSGAVKLSSGDPTWRDLSAMTYHYETQPLPTLLAWYAHQFPFWFQQLSTILMYVIEMAVPFLIFFPRRPRHWAAMILISFQILIMATGNYGFFNCLAIALCIPLLDDSFLRRAAPATPLVLTYVPRQQGPRPSQPLPAKLIFIPLACVYLFISSLQVYASAAGRRDLPPSLLQMLYAASPFRTINNYGLFAVMTTRRVEIIVEGSQDGKDWKAYAFKWKPGDVDRAPRFNIPHQPRLDWQMWFAALSPFQQNPWLAYFLVRLLANEPAVIKLLKNNPFPESPPKFIRAMAYEYKFTDAKARQETGQWWARTMLGLYGPVISLR